MTVGDLWRSQILAPMTIHRTMAIRNFEGALVGPIQRRQLIGFRAGFCFWSQAAPESRAS